MTIDREELRRRHAAAAEFLAKPLTEWTNTGVHEMNENRAFCVDAIPALLDALDSADQRIAKLENTAHVRLKLIEGLEAGTRRRDQHISELESRLLIATETNIADRKRMRALEDGLREALTRDIDRDDALFERLHKLAGEP